MLEMTGTLTREELGYLEATFWLRYPNESCGLILPSSYKNKTVFELPNRSLTPQNSFMMKSSDIRLELDEWFNSHPDDLSSVIFWHSHPSGDPKASKNDRNHRVSGALNLIISCPEIEAELVTYWF